MRRLRLFGLLAVAAVALMSFAGPAVAKLTSPEGTTYGGTIHTLSSGAIEFDGSVDIACESSGLDASVEAGATSGGISWLYFLSCGKDTVNVISNGAISIASNNSVSTTGTEITAQLHRSVLGFPVTTHCIFKTNNTKIGTVIEGSFPSLNIESAVLPQVATDSACGETTEMTGYYFILEPLRFYVD